MEGIIYSGINNIYRVKNNNREWLCRIKGKKLKDSVEEYNPLAVGDRVIFQPDPQDPEKGMIEERLERWNQFRRLNQKRKSPQVIAANLDGVLCLTSPEEPPFRPRFLDRALIAVEEGGCEAVILVNKSDQTFTPEMEERLENYRSMGYRVMRCSAISGEGLEELEEFLMHRDIALFGQSGVGKSTLLNRLEPGQGQKTGEISKKYNRGRHTTNFSLRVDRPGGGSLIDTPGIRQLFLFAIEPPDLSGWFRDFAPWTKDCSFRGCLHDQEEICGVKTAVSKGEIHEDRYESYLRILEDLQRDDMY